MAATSDRLGVYIHERRSSYFHDFPIADGEVLPEGTLAQLNGSGDLETLTHAAGDDDSGVVPLAVLAYQEEDQDPIDDVHRDRGGTSPTGRAYEGIILELEDDGDDLSQYTVLESTAYAVDNETVAPDETDGSGGSHSAVGTVVRKKEADGTVLVHIDGAIT